MALIELNRDPSPRQLRQFAGIWFPAFCALVGALLLHASGSLGWAAAVWVPAGVLSAMGLIVPRAIRPVFLALMWCSFPLGWTLAHFILATVFFLILTPIGWVLRLLGRDPMRRAFAPEASTYWIERKPPEDTTRYFRQF